MTSYRKNLTIWDAITLCMVDICYNTAVRNVNSWCDVHNLLHEV